MTYSHRIKFFRKTGIAEASFKTLKEKRESCAQFAKLQYVFTLILDENYTLTNTIIMIPLYISSSSKQVYAIFCS